MKADDNKSEKARFSRHLITSAEHPGAFIHFKEAADQNHPQKNSSHESPPGNVGNTEQKTRIQPVSISLCIVQLPWSFGFPDAFSQF